MAALLNDSDWSIYIIYIFGTFIFTRCKNISSFSRSQGLARAWKSYLTLSKKVNIFHWTFESFFPRRRVQRTYYFCSCNAKWKQTFWSVKEKCHFLSKGLNGNFFVAFILWCLTLLSVSIERTELSIGKYILIMALLIDVGHQKSRIWYSGCRQYYSVLKCCFYFCF